MSSTSGSEYRRMCNTFIEEALLRPKMYFKDLPELESILHGHGVAFGQLGFIGQKESFNRSFAAWLHQEMGASAAAGWADAIAQLAKTAESDPERLFVDHVREFLAGWVTGEPSPA